MVRDASYANYTRGMLGHSMDLENEEEPLITANDEAIFEPNMVICVEGP